MGKKYLLGEKVQIWGNELFNFLLENIFVTVHDNLKKFHGFYWEQVEGNDVAKSNKSNYLSKQKDSYLKNKNSFEMKFYRYYLSPLEYVFTMCRKMGFIEKNDIF